MLTLAAVAALTAAACGEAPTGTLSTRAGYTVSSDEVPVSICPAGDESRLAEEEGTLIGPHFALRVECAVSFKEIPEEYQLEYLFGEDETLFPAEAGFEFTMVQFAPESETDGEFEVESSTELRTVIAIGEQEWDLDGEVPAPGSVYLTVAEEGAAMSVSVDDSGREQSIDLRERTREGLVESLYAGAETEVVTKAAENSVDGYKSTGGYEYWVEDWAYTTRFTATRSVYDEDDGWIAEPDRAVLTVSFSWLRDGNGLVWNIDAAEALKVSGPDGAMEPASVDHTNEDLGDGYKARNYELVFDVPADALEFTLKFHPDGPIEWPEHGISMPITGDKSHELKVDFA